MEGVSAPSFQRKISPVSERLWWSPYLWRMEQGGRGWALQGELGLQWVLPSAEGMHHISEKGFVGTLELVMTQRNRWIPQRLDVCRSPPSP